MPDKEFSKKFCGILVDVCLIIVVASFLSWSFLTRVVMQGFSMNPTIKDREVVFINRLYKNMLKLDRYDIIAFHMEDQENIKRIIGLPGDHIKISSGNIYVNGSKIEEDFMQVFLSSNFEQDLYVENDEYYVLGDNLDSSKDSRYKDFGNVQKNRVIGKVWHKFGVK